LEKAVVVVDEEEEEESKKGGIYIREGRAEDASAIGVFGNHQASFRIMASVAVFGDQSMHQLCLDFGDHAQDAGRFYVKRGRRTAQTPCMNLL
jgi:hypothetical protein